MSSLRDDVLGRVPSLRYTSSCLVAVWRQSSLLRSGRIASLRLFSELADTV